MKKDHSVFLLDILQAIDDIQAFVYGISFGDFLKDLKTQYAVLRGLEVIGEAVKNLPVEFRTGYGHVPWKNIAGMRDMLIHEYSGIDLDVVWKTVTIHLPALKEDISQIIKER